MRATLIAGESYDVPPWPSYGVLVGIKGVVHVVRKNRGTRVLLFCADADDGTWKQYEILEQGWFEVPTCVRCAIHPGAIVARFNELQWREEWWQREGNQLAAPREVEPTL